jgi:urea transport system permease protein
MSNGKKHDTVLRILLVLTLASTGALATLPGGGTWAANGDAATIEGPATEGSTTAADPFALLEGLRSGDSDIVLDTIMKMAQTGDPRMEELLEAFRIGNLYVFEERIHLGGEVVEDADFNKFVPLLDLRTREAVVGENGEPRPVAMGELKSLAASRRERSMIGKAQYLLRLSSKDPDIRQTGAKRCGEVADLVEAIEPLEVMAAQDPIEKNRYVARESLLLLRLSNPDRIPDGRTKTDAILELGEMDSLRSLPRLEATASAIAAAESAPTPEEEAILKACRTAIGQINAHQRSVRLFENVFQGISLGSILIFMALGLAITFGLMGVINMAHGELMMIGAYATYEMQLLAMKLIERGVIPESAYDWYYAAALPASFIAAAIVGYIIEILVIRRLYRRPIESLLATWGIGLVLIQMVRIHYGDNIGVNAPSWARGGVEIMQDVTLPYGRTFVIALCAVCICGIWTLMRKTRMGLLMRTTMQNRDMANALGVNTSKIDRFTFALGSGIAGIAGCAWTLIGGVTPDMGQKNFIVDSFLIVVTGGVGELAGVICSGLGIGILTKVIEPLGIGQSTLGAIWAKVIVLLLIIAFIQFRPAGLFAPKGRLSDG